MEDKVKQDTIDISELSKIPFIDPKNIGGRVITTLNFFENGEWHIYFPVPNKIIRIKGEPSEADYFARVREKDTDIYLEFLNFMSQRACWADTMLFVDGIRNDVHNLGASLGKLDLFHRSFNDNRYEISRFVSTEIEYIFGVCRSIFDLLQEMIATLWQRIELSDKNIKKKQLPKLFSNVVLANEKLRTAEEIKMRFHIPIELASFYYRQGTFFQVLRKYRDNVVHNGKDFSSIFVTEKGFAVNDNVEPFASFGVWNEKHMLKNRLALLRPIVAHVVTQTFRACEEFSQTIQKIIRFPSDIAPGFKLFLRGYHNRQLLEMKDVLANCSWWEPEHDTTGSK